MELDVKLGRPVRTSDGQTVGRVDRVVLDPDSDQFIELIAHKGHVLTQDRIVDKQLIDRIDQDGCVHLTIDSHEADALPAFVPGEHIVGTALDSAFEPARLADGSTMIAPVLWRSAPEGASSEHGGTHQYVAAVAESLPLRLRATLPDNAVSVGKGTEVVSSDFKKLGVVDDITYDEAGRITGFIAHSGHLHHHAMTIPRDWIESITHRTIYLSVPASQFEGAS